MAFLSRPAPVTQHPALFGLPPRDSVSASKTVSACNAFSFQPYGLSFSKNPLSFQKIPSVCAVQPPCAFPLPEAKTAAGVHVPAALPPCALLCPKQKHAAGAPLSSLHIQRLGRWMGGPGGRRATPFKGFPPSPRHTSTASSLLYNRTRPRASARRAGLRRPSGCRRGQTIRRTWWLCSQSRGTGPA